MSKKQDILLSILERLPGGEVYRPTRKFCTAEAAEEHGFRKLPKIPGKGQAWKKVCMARELLAVEGEQPAEEDDLSWAQG